MSSFCPGESLFPPCDAWLIASPSHGCALCLLPTHKHLLKPFPFVTFVSTLNYHSQVIQYARRLPCYLNRQFITLLSTLGVPDQPIEDLYDAMVANLDKVSISVHFLHSTVS